MPAKPLPQALPIATALDRSNALAGLVRRVQESKARFEAVAARLPPALRAHVQPGPVDDEGWALLAANAAVAAKLRHLLPLLQDALAEAGWPQLALRVKIVGG